MPNYAITVCIRKWNTIVHVTADDEDIAVDIAYKRAIAEITDNTCYIEKIEVEP